MRRPRYAACYVAMLGALALGCGGAPEPAPDASHAATEDASASAPPRLDAGASAGVVIEPAHVRLRALEGGSGVLAVRALTLREGAAGPELYAAVHNSGDVPACSAALSVELFDELGESLAAGISGLLTRHFYATREMGSVAACVGPGEVSLVAIGDWSAPFALSAVAHVVYRCPYFALSVDPIEGLSVHALRRVAREGGTAFQGRLDNALSVSVVRPSVSVFTLGPAGRPLALATARSTGDLPPSGSWTFETEAVQEPGSSALAYPAGELLDRGRGGLP